MSVEAKTTDAITGDQAARIASFLQAIADESCDKRLVGIAIGAIVRGQEFRAVSGWADAESPRPVSEATIFEIGSLSKLFTSLLLAVAATKGELRLDDPVQTALGEQVTLPTDGKSAITFRSLANHRSSLPRLPDDLIATADMQNPYAHYDQEMLYAYLNKMKSLKPIGSREEYSNLGVGLLGHALGKVAGSDYRTALRERVLVPLGMLQTSSEASDQHAAQLATSHQKKNQPTRHWDFSEATAAAGCVRSSLADMLKFLRATVYPKSTELAEAILLTQDLSDLPACRRGPAPPLPAWFAVPLVLAFASLFALVVVLPNWLAAWTGSNVNNVPSLDRPGFLPYFTIFAVAMGATTRWGSIAGVVALSLACLLGWQFWNDDLGWSAFVFGALLVYVGYLFRASREYGAGRLAWQGLAVGPHPTLWHNGMVGGAASFLGIVPELEIGVVVLTNTAASVDAMGVKILSALAEETQRGQGAEGPKNGL